MIGGVLAGRRKCLTRSPGRCSLLHFEPRRSLKQSFWEHSSSFSPCLSGKGCCGQRRPRCSGSGPWLRPGLLSACFPGCSPGSECGCWATAASWPPTTWASGQVRRGRTTPSIHLLICQSPPRRAGSWVCDICLLNCSHVFPQQSLCAEPGACLRMKDEHGQIIRSINGLKRK